MKEQDAQVERCKKLVYAVLITALDDIKRGSAASVRIEHGKHITANLRETLEEATSDARNALRWVASESTTPYSFKWSCEILGMDADRYRRKILLGNFKMSADVKSERRSNQQFASL